MKKVKKALVILIIVPVLIVITGITKYNFELRKFFNQKSNTVALNINKSINTKSKVYIVGTVHFETDSIKRHNLYEYINKISPNVILYEGDSSTVRRIVNKTNYIDRFINGFKKRKEMEKTVVLKYLKNNPSSILLPYEWEIRDKYHRKHKLNKNSSALLNAVIKLYKEDKLPQEQSIIVKRFIEINKPYYQLGNYDSLDYINSKPVDNLIKERQKYVYKYLPEIAKGRKDLSEFKDFLSIHSSYWDTRNKAMVTNIIKNINAHPGNTFVVLNGFSHRYYLIDELKKYENKFNFSVEEI